MIKKRKMFRIAFSTHRIDSNIVVYEKDMLDPDKIVRKTNFPEKFKIVLAFEDLEIEEMGNEGKAQVEGLDYIKDIVRAREKEGGSDYDAQILVFGDPAFDDRMEMMVNHPGEDEIYCF